MSTTILFTNPLAAAGVVASAFFTIVAIYIAHEFVRTFLNRRPESIPEAFPFAFTYDLATMQDRIMEKCLEVMQDMYSTTGKKTFCFKAVGLAPFVMTGDIANITYILKTNFENFGKSGGNFKPKMQGLLGNGIFNADGDQWYVHRKTSAHLFKLGQFKTSVLETFHEHLVIATSLIRSKAEKAFDLQDVMHRLTLDSIGKIAFGINLDSLRIEGLTFAADFDYCTACMSDSFTNPFWKIERYFTSRGWKYFQALRRINVFAKKIVQERRAEISKQGAIRSGRVDLLSLYLDKDSFDNMESEKGGKNLYMEPTDSNLRDVVLNMVIAGRDTTAQALSWAFFEFCKHQDVQARAREEIRGVLLAEYREKFADTSLTDKDILVMLAADDKLVAELLSYNATQKLRYIEACCMETLRLYPSVPKEGKEVMKDDILPDGTKVYKGDIISFQPWAMGRDPDLWGPNCLQFDPLRFFDKPKPNPFVFTAFQAGPRTCLGQNFAILEMKSTIGRFLFLFDFVLAQPVESVTYTPSLTLPIKGGLQVLAKEIQYCAIK
ncbi:cytochrome P450 [archaeon]|nr:MAG: cytochrome P450 [archaeon]